MYKLKKENKLRIQLKEKTDWEGNFNGYFEVYLNGRPVGNDAQSVNLTKEFDTLGFESIKVNKVEHSYQMEIITGKTKTGKVFEIYGGRKSGGSRNDWFLEVDGVCVGYEKCAKHLIQILCCVSWTEDQIELSNNLYKRQIAR